MVRIAILFEVLISVMLVVPCFATLPPVTEGLVGRWNFEEGTGITATDSSGNGNNGTIMNATHSTDTPSQSLSAYSLRFNNTYWGNAYSYVTIPDAPSLRPNSSLTLALWIRPEPTVGRTIISKQYGTLLADSFIIWYHDDGNLWFATSVGYVVAQRPSVNEWHHIAATYDGSFMRLFVDGVERVNSSATGSLVYDGNPVLIGADDNNEDNLPDEGWYGLIDEVLIYSRALSALEIRAIMGYDVLAPEVGTPILNPTRDNVQPNQNVTVSVNATDLETGVKNVTLIYSLDNGTTWENPEPMDLNITSNFYEGTIPGQPFGTVVRFKIVAFDNAGNNATKDGVSPDYTYIVVPEFPSFLVLPIFMTAILMAVIFLRRRRRVQLI